MCMNARSSGERKRELDIGFRNANRHIISMSSRRSSQNSTYCFNCDFLLSFIAFGSCIEYIHTIRIEIRRSIRHHHIVHQMVDTFIDKQQSAAGHSCMKRGVNTRCATSNVHIRRQESTVCLTCWPSTHKHCRPISECIPCFVEEYEETVTNK